jgi:hypothetical protein
MKKIVIVGAGNAGCFTALHYAWHTRNNPDIHIELRYDPTIAPEPVGQATLLDPPKILWAALGFNWHNNPIHATMKSGILYEQWGNANDKIYHSFPADTMAMHYSPAEMQDFILKSRYFDVVECNVDDLSQIDADYIFDCRGKPSDMSDYDILVNPTNAVHLGKPRWDTSVEKWSRHVATQDGWTFVIPTAHTSPSHEVCVGYLYNDEITTDTRSKFNFLKTFDVEYTKTVKFQNYVAKNPVIDDRIILNGNRLFFLEPLESSSVQTYYEWIRRTYEVIVNGNGTLKEVSDSILRYIEQTQNFVLWHYKSGSLHETPFWEYASSLKFHDQQFSEMLLKVIEHSESDVLPVEYGGLAPSEPSDYYGQWTYWNMKIWHNGVSFPRNIQEEFLYGRSEYNRLLMGS